MASKLPRLCLLLGLLSLGPPAWSEEVRPFLDLDGTWQFTTDPRGEGEADGWYRPEAAWPTMPLPGFREDTAGSIIVPGSWDEQGYGEPTDARFHRFEGMGWYRRTMGIPADWADHSIFLIIGGVHRQARIWVNGQFVADHVGYLSSLDLDISDYVQAGWACTITIRVDSRQDTSVDVLRGTTDGVEMRGGGWGGIWGHVALEARRDAYLEDPLIETVSIAPATVQVSATLAGDLPQRADHVEVTMLDATRNPVAQARMELSLDDVRTKAFRLEVPMVGAKPWSPDAPNLYTARIVLLGEGQPLDGLEQRFGVRELKIDGQYFVLNGSRVFLAGAGDDNVYPDDFGALYVDRAKLLRRTRLMKTYGFNAIRTHTSVMSPDFYDVCDEVGMLVRAEFPLGGRPINQARQSPAAQKVLDHEVQAALLRHRNHPSLYSWSMGNEIRPARQPLMLEFARRLKRTVNAYDPDAFFIDGTNTGYFRKGPKGVNVHYNDMSVLDRDTLDYSSPVAYSSGPPYEFGGMRFDHSEYASPKPAIIHESGEFVTFPNLAYRSDFKDSVKADWLDRMAERYEAMGLLGENALWTEVSEKLYMDSHKLEMENIRLQDAHAGYDMWLFQDFWNTSNGVMTAYLRPKQGVPADQFSKFNNADTVLLKKNLQLTYRGGDKLSAELLVWHYGPRPIAGATLHYTIACAGRVLDQGTRSAIAAAQGDVTLLGNLGVTLPEVAEPTQLEITAQLEHDGRTFDNTWTARVFPRVRAPVETALPVYTAPENVGTFAPYGASAMPTSGPLPAKAIYLVDTLDERLVDALEHGARVVLMHPGQEVFPSYDKLRWRSGFWSGNKPWRSVGTVLYDTPLARSITSANWLGHEWWYLFEDSRAYYLDRIPTPTDVVIRNIDGAPQVSDKALLFAVRVGRGGLWVSGLNHLHDTDRPEIQWVTDQIARRAGSPPLPQHELAASWLRERLRAVAAVPANTSSR